MSIQMTLALTREQFRLDVDISVPIDGVTAISGPSGAGKTSLLRCIAGLEPDCRGQIRLNQSSWHNGKHWLKPEYRRVGYVMQQAELFPHLDVAGNIRFAQQRAKAEELIDIQQVIRVFEIEELLTRMPYSLSGGQKQRVAIVRALASQPQILLLDEPFSSLDYTLKLTMYGYFEQMLKVCPLPVFLVSHDMHEIARLSDRVLAMIDGQVTGLNDTAQALNDLQGPLTLCENARSVIHGQISQHEPQFGLTSVKVGQQVIQVPQVNASVDEQIKVIIDPCDVSLHLDHDSHTSILNQLECQVLDWRNNDETSMMIQLGFEQQTLLCKISVKSFHCLQIAQGIPIIAQVKSVSLT